MTNRLLELMAEKQIKEHRPITVTIMSREMGMSRQAIYDWINDDLTSYPKKTINQFCEYFDCNPGDLIIRTKEADEPELEPAGG